MGSFDGAETCELVGLYILSQLEPLGINVGLYRDDGLAISNKTPKQTENIKKKVSQIFKQNKLKITIDANHKTVDFLDITMDLRTGHHKPYMKPNNTPQYVHKESNHPPNIIKNIPEGINKRLSTISSNEDIFNQAAPTYQEALGKSGYAYKLKYNPTQQHTGTENTTRKRQRTRKITWFNPPYSASVGTNIGQKFINMLETCFPPSHQLHKILNRNTVKISYSCMPNMKQVISSHNKATLQKDNHTETTTTTQKTCNCRQRTTCPLDGQCLTSGLIYQATVTQQDNDKDETYIGLTDNTFKTRYNGHTNSFRDERKRNATALSQHIWSLKDRGKDFKLGWRMVARGRAYSPSSRTCHLCLKEKYFIICKPQMSSLNYRNELASACRHRKRHLLCNFT